MKYLYNFDPELAGLIQNELNRQVNNLELIASENFVSEAVLEAMGSILTNKYSEGFPCRRYYGGNKFIDNIESLAIERAKQLFGVDHVNVQPYSGSPANLAALSAVCEPGDTIMGLDLRFGGHLTHGWKVSITSKFFKSTQYITDKKGFINYDELEKLAKKIRPRVIISGSTAYPRIYDYKRFGEIAKSVDAFYLADIAHEAGLIAAGLIPSPVGHADIITTTTHKTLRGPRGAMIMCNGNPSNPLKTPEKICREELPTLIDRAVFPGTQGGPHNHTTAGIAVALKEDLQPEFKTYAEQILKNAKILSEKFLENNFTLVTGGTDNHLMMIDLRNTDISGKSAEKLLEKVNITVNKNTVPFDPNPPFNPSGIRIGVPALTTRGFTENNMSEIGQIISDVLNNPKDKIIHQKARDKVQELCDAHPIYGELSYDR